MSDITIKLTAPQWKAINSEATETFFLGGVGAGKTAFLAIALAKALEQKGIVCAVFAPTRKVLKNSTWVAIKHFWKKMGIIERESFVYGIQPPAQWGVEKFSMDSHNILTMRNGSYCIMDGLTDPNSQRGTEFDEIYVDEFRDVSESAREVLLGRLRGKLYAQTGQKYKIWYATTPPENVDFLRQLLSLNSKEIRFIFGATYSNINLKKEYVQRLKDAYDEITYRREVLGELISYISNKFYCSFIYDRNVKSVIPDRRKAIYLSFDFNINPMTCIAAQHSEGQIHIVKEWFIPNTQVPAGREPIAFITELIKPYASEFPEVNVTGDASGHSGSALAKKGDNYYRIIQSILPQAKIKVPSQNPKIVESRTVVNSMLEKHAALFIDPSCKRLINDLECVGMKEGGLEMDKSNAELTHISDCFRYYLNTYFGGFLKISRKVYDVSDYQK